MKIKLLFLLFLYLNIPVHGQQIKGVVYFQNSGGKTAENIKISAFGCDTKYTLSDGSFILPCSNKNPGDKVKLLIGKTDGKGKNIEVINADKLSLLTIPSASNSTIVEIIICYAGQRDEAALRYYDIIVKPTNIKYANELKKLQDKLDKNTLSNQERDNFKEQIKQLKNEQSKTLSKLEEQAQSIASINLDQAPDLIKNAIKKIEAGEAIKEALATIFDMPNASTLQDYFAKVFNRPSELIELNFPPVDGRYPGAVLVSPQKGQTLVMKREYRPDKLPSTSSNISINLNGASTSGMVSNLLGNFSSYKDISVQIDINDLRMFEIEFSKPLKKALIADRSIYRAEKKGLKPRTIMRSYEGKVSYTIKRSSSIKSESWEKIKSAALQVGGNMTNGGGIRIQNKEASVIAYESVFVNYIVNNLNAGEPDDVVAKEYIVKYEDANPFDISGFGLSPGNDKVSYFAMGNSKYDSEKFANLNVIEGSTQLFENTLRKTGAAPLFDHPPSQVVSSSQMDKLLDDISRQIKKDKSESLFVFYYVGHAISGPNGHLYLVMKDYKGDPKNDIGENYLYGISVNPMNGSNHSLGNSRPEKIDGLYPVSKIQKHLSKLNIPFLMLVDACYSLEELDNLRDQLQITFNGDYYGLSDDGGPEEVNRYANAIQDFGDVDYLKSKNVVILSSAPGSIALVVPAPNPTLLQPKNVAPLARRIHNRFEAALLYGEPVSYGSFFNSIIDVKQLGEVRIHGTTSWSNFSVLNEIKMLKKNN